MQKAHHSERDLGSLMGKVDVAHGADDGRSVAGHARGYWLSPPPCCRIHDRNILSGPTL